MTGGVRRPQSRSVRARVAALQRARGEDTEVMGLSQDVSDMEEEEEEGERDYEEELVEEMVEREERKVGKVGTKKLKRIQEKAERKVAREVSDL